MSRPFDRCLPQQHGPWLYAPDSGVGTLRHSPPLDRVSQHRLQNQANLHRRRGLDNQHQPGQARRRDNQLRVMERPRTDLRLLQMPALAPLPRLRGDLGNRPRRFVPENGHQRLSRRDGLRLPVSVLVSERQRRNPNAATSNPHLLVERLPICEKGVTLGNLEPALANEKRRLLVRRHPRVRKHVRPRRPDPRAGQLRQPVQNLGRLLRQGPRVDQPRQRVLKRGPLRRQGQRPDPLPQLDLRVGPLRQRGPKTDLRRSTELRPRLVQSDRPKTLGSTNPLAVN
jgi:hypothetical protein